MPDDFDQVSSKGNGRKPDGTFAPGHKFSRGNGGGRRAQRIRLALLRAVDPKRVTAAANKLMQQAEEGDRQALAELLDRTIGRPSADTAMLERIEAIERHLAQQRANGGNGRLHT